MALQEGKVLAHRLGDHLLALVEVGEQVDENVGHRDTPGDREPDAAGSAVEEAQPVREEAYDDQADHGEQRDGGDDGHGLVLPYVVVPQTKDRSLAHPNDATEWSSSIGTERTPLSTPSDST